MKQYIHIYVCVMPFIRFWDSGVMITNFKIFKWYSQLPEGLPLREVGVQKQEDKLEAIAGIQSNIKVV